VNAKRVQKEIETKEKTDMKSLTILVMGLVLGGFLQSGEVFGAAVSDKTQTVSGGGVTAKVTYLNPKTNDEPRFQVVLDTHSVALDSYDLKSLSVLHDDTGKTYLPVGAENKGTGHHREIVLTFSKPGPEGKRVELVIKDIAGVKERIFRWNLE
jgi:hypothetical protein